MARIVLGFAPTRRSIFSAPDAVKYADLTRARLRELGVEFVDMTLSPRTVCCTMTGIGLKLRRNSVRRRWTACFSPTEFRDRVRGGETGEGSECAGASVGAER